MTAFVNYPMTASDDDEFFDAPAGSTLILCDEDYIEVTRYTKTDDGWLARAGDTYQPGELWASLFADGNPFGEHGVRANTVLRVDQAFAQAFGTFGVWAA